MLRLLAANSKRKYMKPQYEYDLAIIGAGPAGLAAAHEASRLGAKTILVEKSRLGGESLWTGSVPSKTLMKSARVFDTIKRAEEFGVHVEATRLVWGAVRMRMAAVRDEIKTLERKRLEASGVELLIGGASFSDPHTLSVQGKNGVRRVGARSIILATGGQLKEPNIPGLATAGYLTQETIFEVNPLPRSMAIIGGGPLGCELGQAFQRFGCKVTLLTNVEGTLRLILEQEGVTIPNVNGVVVGAGTDDEGKWVEFEDCDNKPACMARVAQILLLADKQFAPQGLDCEVAGVRYDTSGPILDACLRTSADNIWACGDIAGPSHRAGTAQYQGEVAAKNAILPEPAKVDYRLVPRVIFTDPEVAHLGLSEMEAIQGAGGYKIFRAEFSENHRAIIEGETAGNVEIITRDDGQILGVTIMGPNAAELIHNYSDTVRNGTNIQEFVRTAHAYPTLSEIGHRAAIGS